MWHVFIYMSKHLWEKRAYHYIDKETERIAVCLRCKCKRKTEDGSFVYITEDGNKTNIEPDCSNNTSWFESYNL